MGYDLSMRVWRGDAGGGALGDYTVPVEEGEVVLDAIHRLQATQAGDLAVRWNCKAGKCGSCSAEVNGRPRLMCMTRLSDFDPAETITVTPVRTFPVIRDLVTDVSFNYEKAKQVPAVKLTPRDRDGKRRMMQSDVERGQEFRKCIECFLCQNVCHVIRDLVTDVSVNYGWALGCPRSLRRTGWSSAGTGWPRPTSTEARSSASASSAGCARTSAT